jgi:hypothetical protein
MKENLGTADRITRIFIGAVIITAGIYFETWLGLIGIVPLATSLIKFCPLYALFGISTCPAKESQG